MQTSGNTVVLYLVHSKGSEMKVLCWIQLLLAFVGKETFISNAFTLLQHNRKSYIRTQVGTEAFGNYRNNCFLRETTTKSSCISLFQAIEDENDGWGDDNASNKSSQNNNYSSVKEITPLSDKERELASLRSQMDSKSNNKRQMTENNQIEEGTERDLFIPIFAVVSLVGLFGAYGYEMLRLYSQGELYLPGM